MTQAWLAMETHPPQSNLPLDCISGPWLGSCLEKMAIGERWIVTATLGGAPTEINRNTILRKGIKLIGSTLRSRSSEMKAAILQLRENISKVVLTVKGHVP